MKACKHCGADLLKKDATACAACGKSQRSVLRSCLVITGLSFIGIILLIVLGGLAGGSHSTDPHTVRYIVSGTAEYAGITLQNVSGGTEQRAVKLPWESTFQVRSGQFAYISAQKKSEGGTITATIEVDGSQIQTATSTEPYGIATASGSVGR